MTTRLFFVFLVFFFSSKSSFSQYNDFGNWNSLSVKSKLTKGLKLDVGIQMRLNENASQVKTFFSDIDLSYTIAKKTKVFFSYRLDEKRQLKQYYLASHRFSLGFSTKKAFENFKLGYRFKVQRSDNSLQSLDRGLDFSSGFRNKLSVSKKIIKKTYGWLSFEMFSSQNLDNFFYFSDWRWKIGIDRKVKKNQYFSLGFLVQKELQANNPVTDYILILGYKMELKKRKKKKNLPENSTLKGG